MTTSQVSRLWLPVCFLCWMLYSSIYLRWYSSDHGSWLRCSFSCCRSIKRCWVYSVRSTGWSGESHPEVERVNSRGGHGTHHGQVCQQSFEQQQGSASPGSLPLAAGKTLRRTHPPPRRTFPVHSSISAHQVSLRRRIGRLSLTKNI